MTGRTEILIVSIKTRKGFNHVGAPPGRIPAKKFEGEFEIEDIIRANHNGNAKLKVKNRWLEDLKTYGSSPVKLTVITMEKRDTKIGENPFRFFPKVRVLCSNIIDFGRDTI